MGEVIAKLCSPKEVDELGPVRDDMRRTKKKVEFIDTKYNDSPRLTNSSPVSRPVDFDGRAVYSSN